MASSSHISGEDLLLWQTGELLPDDEQKIRKHLQTCSECQKRLERLDLLHAEAEWAGTHIAESRMQTLMEQQEQSRWKSPLIQWPRHLVTDRPWTTATATIVIAALLLMTFAEFTPAAKAEALLTKAVQRENEAAFRPHLLRVQAGTTLCQMNVEREGVQRLLAPRESGGCDSVSTQFHTVGWGWEDLLSARSFGQWRHALKEKRDFIVKLPDATEVSTSTDEGPIRKATLRIRNTDYHPVSARFQFADRSLPEAEIEVTETPAVGVPNIEVASAAPSLAAPKPTDSAVIDPLDEAEAAVRLALHYTGMDDSALVAVERQASVVRVWGAVPTESDKSSLEKQLGNTPNTALAIQTDAEVLKSQTPLPWQAWQGSASPLASEQLDSLFAGNPEARQVVQNNLHEVTLRLVAKAKSRDGMLKLLKDNPEAPYAVELRQTAADLRVSMLADQKQLCDFLKPILGSSDGSAHPFSTAQAIEVYGLVHEVAVASKGDAPTLDEAKTRLDKILRHP